MGTIEQRRLFRAETFTKVLYETVKSPSVKGEGLTLDISSIGIHMVCTNSLEAGAELLLKFFIEGRKSPVPTLARVVWQRKCDYVPESQKSYYTTGLTLLEMSPQDAVETSDFISIIARKHQISCEKKAVDKIEKGLLS